MTAATWPREDRAGERLLVVDRATARFSDAHVRDLPSYLRSGDLLVVNDAATLPASLRGAAAGGPVEVRLAGELAHGRWRAVLLGAGDWRMRTEDRPAPPLLGRGEVIGFGAGLTASIEAVSPLSPRLVDLCFDLAGDALWAALYRIGRPVQYSYLAGPLELWHTQTAYASRPWAVEQPSAGRPLAIETLVALRRVGVGVATLTHAAGLSSTGDAAIDAALPFAERYEIPAETVAAIEATRGRVIAAGTTVVRALEGAAAAGELSPGPGVTDLVIGPRFQPRIVHGLFTGLHEPGSSHYQLLQAFAPVRLLDAAYAHAEAEGYLGHEFGDSSLIV